MRDMKRDWRWETKVGLREKEHILRQGCEIWPSPGLLSTEDDHIPSDRSKMLFRASSEHPPPLSAISP